MARNVIYFPYMELLEDQWLNQVLLYWDDVYSIIPSNYKSNTFVLSDYTVKLIREELVKTFNPDDYLNPDYLSEKKLYNFYNLFLDHVKREEYPVPNDTKIRSMLPTLSVHMDKLAYYNEEQNILRDLDKLGLVKEKNFPWIEVEEYTAKSYIAYLAAFGGELPEIQASPVTNDPKELKPYTPSYYQNGQIKIEKDEMRTTILDNILPTPNDPIDIEILKKFKNRHSDDLIEFRKYIESEIHDLLKERDLSYRNELKEDFVVETQDRINEISESMKKKGWKINKGMCLNIVGAILDSVNAIPASLDYHHINPLLLGKAVLNGAKTIYEVYNYNNNGIKDDDLAYAIYCKKELFKD
ncbi:MULTISPECIES: hypothetical protein [Methanobacterium]|uniref:Uncharacterized protein n=1 Tax=Methanobacterium veterum TaxID=408577 RepID=A0A9E5DM05_9EURY|nr:MULTISPECIES: hypothetical protein [Methanobacterium]MCZ3367259.1 hypothetical protein [Methanobacterium veterum]MCZ3373593.1 hypothetical protein [Methanobacterium veterum]